MTNFKNHILCYAFRLKDGLFETIVKIHNYNNLAQRGVVEFKGNFCGSVNKFVEGLRPKEASSIFLNNIFTKELESRTKELLVCLRSSDERISRSPFVVFSFVHEDKVDRIFKSTGCYLVYLPSKISDLSALFQKEPISEEERKEFLGQFGGEFLRQKIREHAASAKHRIGGQFRLSVGVVENFFNGPSRERFNQVYDLFIRAGAVERSRQIWLELNNEYKRCFGQENEEIKQIGDSVYRLEFLLKDGYEGARVKAKQLKELIVYLSNLE